MYQACVARCSLEGDWQEAMRIRTRMQRAGVPLTLHVYNALIAACERAQQAVPALDLYHAMQRDGIRPNYATLTPLTVCCLQNPSPPLPAAPSLDSKCRVSRIRGVKAG